MKTIITSFAAHIVDMGGEGVHFMGLSLDEILRFKELSCKIASVSAVPNSRIISSILT